MNSAVESNFNENFAEKNTMSLVNYSWDPLILTQMQLKMSFSSVQTHAKWIYLPLPK